MAVIIAELILREIKGEVLPVHAMADAVQPLSIAPEALDAIDGGRTFHEYLLMIDRFMFTELLQVVVAGELIRVKDTSLDRSGRDSGHQRLFLAVGSCDGINSACSLQDAQNGDLAGVPRPRLPLRRPPK